VDFDEMEREKNRRFEKYYRPVVPPRQEPEPVQAPMPVPPPVSTRQPLGYPDLGTSAAPYYKQPVTREEIDDERMIEQMENIPAYKRKNMKINNRLPNQNERISRFSLSDDGVSGPRLSKDNPYLFDNVD